MPIESHKNLSAEELGTRRPDTLAAGSSNSNSHNKGGGGEVPVEEARRVLGQLAALLPRLERVAERGERG